MYIRLLYNGDVSYRFERQTHKVKLITLLIIVTPLWTIGSLLSLSVWNSKSKRMSYLPLALVILKFTFECDARCLIRTPQRIVERMRKHVPLATRKGTDRRNGRCQHKWKYKANQARPETDSAIGTHLLSSVECSNT